MDRRYGDFEQVNGAVVNDLRDRIAELELELRGRWIPVEEQMPQSLSVLVAIEGWPGEHFVACGSYTAGQWWYGRSGDEIKSRVTHWMPLPEFPPK